MADSAPFQNFVNALMRRRGMPRVNGRPPKSSTLADLAPLPKPPSAQNPRNRLPQLPKITDSVR